METELTKNMLGVFLDEGSVNRGDIDFSRLKSALQEWRFFDHSASHEVSDRIRDADIVISNKVFLGAEAFQQANKLRLICVAATGTNNVDLDAAKQYGIKVCNVRGYANTSVVQHVFALILALTTHLENYRQVIRGGGWQSSVHFSMLNFPIRELSGKTLGIVGYGQLGQAVAKVAAAFGMNVLLAARPGLKDTRPERVPLEKLLPEVDILTLHCPLSESTRGLIGDRELSLMKPGAILINAARGGIVDEPALAQALRDGRLAGAGVDVLTVEPPRQGNPLLAEDIPNLIVTPHIAWASVESRQRLINEIGTNIEAFLKDEPRNVVA
jgi:glycerate dehydrogenase